MGHFQWVLARLGGIFGGCGEIGFGHGLSGASTGRVYVPIGDAVLGVFYRYWSSMVNACECCRYF